MLTNQGKNFKKLHFGLMKQEEIGNWLINIHNSFVLLKILKIYSMMKKLKISFIINIFSIYLNLKWEKMTSKIVKK